MKPGTLPPYRTRPCWSASTVWQSSTLRTAAFPIWNNWGGTKRSTACTTPPALILVACNESGPCAEYDASAATQNILLAAESLGIASCWGYFATQAFMAGEGEALRCELGIPGGYHVYTSVMLGYGNGDAPPEKEIDTGMVHFV